MAQASAAIVEIEIVWNHNAAAAAVFEHAIDFFKKDLVEIGVSFQRFAVGISENLPVVCFSVKIVLGLEGVFIGGPFFGDLRVFCTQRIALCLGVSGFKIGIAFDVFREKFAAIRLAVVPWWIAANDGKATSGRHMREGHFPMERVEGVAHFFFHIDQRQQMLGDGWITLHHYFCVI